MNKLEEVNNILNGLVGNVEMVKGYISGSITKEPFHYLVNHDTGMTIHGVHIDMGIDELIRFAWKLRGDKFKEVKEVSMYLVGATVYINKIKPLTVDSVSVDSRGSFIVSSGIKYPLNNVWLMR